MNTSAAQNTTLPALRDSDEPIEARSELIVKELKRELEKDFLPGYQPKQTTTEKTDTLADRYTLLPNQSLPQFNTKTANAYTVRDEINPERKLYGLVCSHHLPARKKLIQQLKTTPTPHMLTVVEEGIMRISTLQEERYTIIFEQPQGKTLSEVIAGQTQSFSDRYIIEKIVTPLVATLSVFESFGMIHGRINPDNIYVGGNTLTLGECVAEPCGYSQDFHYEPINRLQCHPAGKGGGHVSVDYYAIGVCVAKMKLRPRQLQDPDPDRFTRRLLKEGSYLGIVGYADVSDEIGDLLRGTLNDNQNERWSNKQLKPWCAGKRFNLLVPTIPDLSGRPFELNEQEFGHLRILSHAMHRMWEAAIPPLRDGTLARWIELATRRRDISDYLNRTVRSYANRTGKPLHEMMTRCLFALDAYAPIRMQDMAAHVDGIGTCFAEVYHDKDDAKLNTLGDVIEQSLASNWQEAQRRIFNLDNLSPELQQMIFGMEKIRLFMRNSNLGFGPERMLYELNPTLACQSPILKGYHADTIPRLLIALDHIASKRDRPDVPLDRHIAGFIGAKLNITREVVFGEFAANLLLSKHRGLLALKFLQAAQNNAKNIKLAGLSAWACVGLLDALGTFHSKTLREQMTTALKPMAYGGQLTPILEYLTAYDYSHADATGFITASEQYAFFDTQIKELRNEQLREYKAHMLGSTIAKFIAYTILAVIVFYFYIYG